jgi:hypothetical protein
LQEINNFIKGKIKSNGISRSNHKQVYRIEVIELKRIRDILKEILPYLIIKKPQAQLMFDFCNKRLDYESRNYTDDDFKFPELFAKLNKRVGYLKENGNRRNIKTYRKVLGLSNREFTQNSTKR